MLYNRCNIMFHYYTQIYNNDCEAIEIILTNNKLNI